MDDVSKKHWVDQKYLQEQQYKTAANLTARATLHKRFSINKMPWHEWVFDQIGLQAGESLLDCGCGPAWLWRENVTRLPADVQLTLTDLSPGMVETALGELADCEAIVGGQPADIMALPFAADSFDVVVANHMLYHVPDRAKGLAEVRRVLKPGGRFVAATNGLNHLSRLRYWARHFGLREEVAKDTSAQLFGLENGAEQLAPWFDTVHMLDYPDGLRVTEVEPVIAYLLSMVGQLLAPSVEQVAEVRAALAEEIAANDGVLVIEKSTGLFVCS
ncbi:MAG TPA: class I SAM-dependent methyltransferase [Anaerolineae bacterium]|nr:class I SAM-dependent methyltransferase [Anaerolineae bacterium]